MNSWPHSFSPTKAVPNRGVRTATPFTDGADCVIELFGRKPEWVGDDLAGTFDYADEIGDKSGELRRRCAGTEKNPMIANGRRAGLVQRRNEAASHIWIAT